jgi:hypothetical protein
VIREVLQVCSRSKLTNSYPIIGIQEPSHVQQTFSKERNPTVWRIIPSLEFLIKRWQTMAQNSRYQNVREAIASGVKSYEKWYRKVDGTSDAYFICLGTLTPFVRRAA